MTFRQSNAALKLEKKASMKHLSLTALQVIVYICSVKIILCPQHSSSDKHWSTGVRRLGLRVLRAVCSPIGQ